MRVGLNLVFLVPGETGGMEVYARQLISQLALLEDVRLTAFVNRVAAERGLDWSGPVEEVVVPVDPRRRVEWVWGEQWHLPRQAGRAGVELMHSLASTGPARGAFRRVVTVHDLIYRIHPEAHFGLRALGMRLLVPLAVKRSQRVIAVSEATRRDLVRLMGVDAGKVDVVPEGVGQPPAGGLDAAAVRARHGLGERPIALSVSAKRPHKNLLRLIGALARIPVERRPLMLLPGYPTPHEAELRRHAEALGVAGDVRLLGWVSAEELEGLYDAAACVVHPSLYEGFGLPVLEAMARGVPVATSSRGSLAEVAGDAALLFDPLDEVAIAEALERLLGDRELAGRLRAAGLEQAARFSWRATAELTLASYRRAFDAPA